MFYCILGHLSQFLDNFCFVFICLCFKILYIPVNIFQSCWEVSCVEPDPAKG